MHILVGQRIRLFVSQEQEGILSSQQVRSAKILNLQLLFYLLDFQGFNYQFIETLLYTTNCLMAYCNYLIHLSESLLVINQTSCHNILLYIYAYYLCIVESFYGWSIVISNNSYVNLVKNEIMYIFQDCGVKSSSSTLALSCKRVPKHWG